MGVESGGIEEDPAALWASGLLPDRPRRSWGGGGRGEPFLFLCLAESSVAGQL